MFLLHTSTAYKERSTRVCGCIAFNVKTLHLVSFASIVCITEIRTRTSDILGVCVVQSLRAYVRMFSTTQYCIHHVYYPQVVHNNHVVCKCIFVNLNKNNKTYSIIKIRGMYSTFIHYLYFYMYLQFLVACFFVLGTFKLYVNNGKMVTVWNRICSLPSRMPYTVTGDV